jgi:hypothetical protein
MGPTDSSSPWGYLAVQGPLGSKGPDGGFRASVRDWHHHEMAHHYPAPGQIGMARVDRAGKGREGLAKAAIGITSAVVV